MVRRRTAALELGPVRQDGAAGTLLPVGSWSLLSGEGFRASPKAPPGAPPLQKALEASGVHFQKEADLREPLSAAAKAAGVRRPVRAQSRRPARCRPASTRT